MNSSKLGVLPGLPVTAPAVAWLMIQPATVAEAASPKVALCSAATPATCGAAIEVPLSDIVTPRSQVDVIADPGAYAYTQLPQFE